MGNVKSAAQFGCAFAHRSDSHSRRIYLRQTHPIIRDLDLEPVVYFEAHSSVFGLGMLGDIGNRLQDDAVSSDLDGGWQLGSTARYFEADLQVSRQLQRGNVCLLYTSDAADDFAVV